MSGRLVGEVLKYAPYDLRMLDRFVLVCLAESAKDGERIARYGVTQDELADKLQANPGSIRNALGRLKERGLIVPLMEKPRKGLAQNWRIPKMTEATRNAVHKASSPGDAMNGTKRHPPMTQKPVDNSPKRHPVMTLSATQSVITAPCKASSPDDPSR